MLKIIVSNGEIVFEDSTALLEELAKWEGKEAYIEILSREKQRTDTQNRALHLYFSHLSSALNAAGNDMRQVIRHDIEIPWTPGSIKEYLWRPVQFAMFGKKSTTKLNTKEVGEIYEAINRTVSERTGVSVDWPSQDTLYYS